MLGHDYMGENYFAGGVVGYGIELFQEEDIEVFDLEKLKELDGLKYDEEVINIRDIFALLSKGSRRLTQVDTNNTDNDAILMLPAFLPWELDDTNRYITKEEINLEIIDLILPYVNISKEEILTRIYDIETGEFNDEGSYGIDLLGVIGYGLTLQQDDIEFFESEKLKELDQDEEAELHFCYAIEQLAISSNYFDCAYSNCCDQGLVLYFKSRMPWKYDEHTAGLTKKDIEQKIMEIILLYLRSNEDANYFLDKIEEINTCFLSL